MNNPSNKTKRKSTDGFTWLIIFLPSLAYYFHRMAGDFFLDRYPIVADTVHIHATNYGQASVLLEDALYLLNDDADDNSNTNNNIRKMKYGVELLWDHSVPTTIQSTDDISKKSANLNGPTWVHDEELGRGYLLYSDTAANRIWRWEVGGGPIAIGRTLYMERSGCRSNRTLCDELNLPGTTSSVVEIGLLKNNPAGVSKLVLAEQGERRIVRLEEDGARTPLATHVNVTTTRTGQPKATTTLRLNGPHDLAYSPFGDLIFTDPNQKRRTNDNNPLPSGVWRVPEAATIPAIIAAESRAAHFIEASHSHPIELLYSKLTVPSGIAFSHDLQSVYISNGDVEDMVIVKLPIAKLDDDEEEEEEEMPRRRLLMVAADDEDNTIIAEEYADDFDDDFDFAETADLEEDKLVTAEASVDVDGDASLLVDAEGDDLDEYIRRLEEELHKLESDEYDLDDNEIDVVDGEFVNDKEEIDDVVNDEKAEGIVIEEGDDDDLSTSDDDRNLLEGHEVIDMKPDTDALVRDMNMVGALDDEPDVIFFNASSALAKDNVDVNAVGLGGLAVDGNGNVWAASPSGVIVISSEGDHLGTISLGDNDIATNVAFGSDGFLYVTTEQKLLRIRSKAAALVVPNMLSKNV